jgi:ubiquitin carboxyl-terminal hydrolase 7
MKALATSKILLLSLSTSSAAVHDASIVSSGLRNLGNTCYMNAQLECAFHIPLVRDIIQRPSDVKSTVGLKALRDLFSEMEQSASFTASSPIGLCRTLGIPVMEQQDSQEFWKLLLPVLKLPALMDLYQGAYEDYISAVDGSDRERRREEPFLDLSLEVAGRPTALSALSEMFGAPELLSEAEGNGWRPEKGAPKVDALKGSLLRVQGLPSLLQLHLKRFQYDWQYESMSKLNSRFSFPAELDMTKICSGITKSEENSALYDLQSIVVHVGEYGSGHYYSYVRPDVRTDVWYRFDDDRVAEVSFKEVVKDAYGGRTAREEKQHAKKGFLKRLFSGGGSYGWGGSKSSAYMLQYVKRSDVGKLYGKS